MNGRAWTEEECLQLEDLWGIRSVGYIAGRLNRSVSAVRQKACKLGLGGVLESANGLPADLLISIIYKYENRGSASCKIQQWLKAGLPVYSRKVVNNSFRLVNIEKFWKWAEQHKNLVDFTRMDVGALGPEPKWMKEKRRIDKKKPSKWKRKWTSHEDGILYSLCDAGTTYNALTEALPRRSEAAIRRRIYDFGLEPPVREANRKWTQEEIDILQGMHAEGYKPDVIASRLRRSVKSCEGKLQFMRRQELKTAEVKE